MAGSRKHTILNKKLPHPFLTPLLSSFFNTVIKSIIRYYSLKLVIKNTLILSLSDRYLKTTAIGLFKIRAGNDIPIETRVFTNKLAIDL